MNEARSTACVGPFRVVQEHAYSTEAFVLCECQREDDAAYSHIVAVCRDYPALNQANSLANADMVAHRLNAHADLVAALEHAEAWLDSQLPENCGHCEACGVRATIAAALQKARGDA